MQGNTALSKLCERDRNFAELVCKTLQADLPWGALFPGAEHSAAGIRERRHEIALERKKHAKENGAKKPL
jgi:hypothetical protein